MQHFLQKLLFLTSILFKEVPSQNLTSPCPRLFTYETRTLERDRYFGNVRIETVQEIHGVWLRLIFDKPLVQLGNWLGEVTTEDNKEFLIRKKKLTLKPGDFLTVRFYVKFSYGREVPLLSAITLNGKIICPEPVATSTTTTTLPPSTTTPATVSVVLEDRSGNETSETTTLAITSTTASPTTVSPTTSSTTTASPTTDSPTTTSRTFPSPYNLIQEIEIPGPTPSYQAELETEDYGEFFQGDLSLVSFRPRYDQCGTVVPPPNRSNDNDEAGVYEGAFPWHAAIYLSKGTELTYICASSLISSRFLLTVAHCVTKRNSELVVRAEHLLIYLGKYYLRRWSNPAIQERQVKEIFIHEGYDHMTTKNDIAILKLYKPVKTTNFVRPVCLWKGDSSLESITGKSGMVVGWGFNENGIVTSKLIKAYMPVASKDTCIRSYPEFFSHFTSNNSFCAGFLNGTSVCNGDSGGGMVFAQKPQGGNKPLYYLRGLVSISVALQNEFKCDSDHYAIFTDVSKYLPWIEQFKIN